MKEKRTVHILYMNNYLPEVTKYTLPTIEAYARKIGAEVNYITKRRWPDWPILTEKLQVFYDGMNSDWNILIDADILVHPDTPDTLGTLVTPDQVASKDAYHASRQLRWDGYFQRDGRDIGLSSCLIMTSRLCHDLWIPIPEEMSLEQASAMILQDRQCIDELCISRNMARFGLKLTAPVDPVKDYDKFHHLGAYGRTEEEMVVEARTWMERLKT